MISSTRRLCRRRALAVALLLTSFGLLFAPAAAGGERIDIGSRRELFVDRLLIERLDGVELRLARPLPAGKALVYDAPWERHFSFYTTVFRDGDTYRMYYRGWPPGAEPVTCYAESDDGIHWRRPKLGIVEVDGSSENNVILDGGAAFCAFRDERPGVPPAERYKACVTLKHNKPWGLVSPDGIHWSKLGEKPLLPRELPNNFDSQNIVFWSEAEEQYVLFSRHMVKGWRAVARATSPDFRKWSKQTPMTYSDTGKTQPSEHLYTNQTVAYFRAPQIYIATAARFMNGRRVLTEQQEKKLDIEPLGGGATSVSDGVLMSCRAGGTEYDRTFRSALVRPGIGASHWVARTNYPACGIVQTGPHEMSIYVQRNYGQKSAYLERMTLRLDGFVAARAPFAGGDLLTRPVVFEGATLEINASTSAAGSILVQLEDADGSPLDGFLFEDCREMVGDDVALTVQWKQGSDVSALAGKPVRLRFRLKDADLYSLKFNP